MIRKYDIIPIMLDIIKSSIKEKVVRMVVSTWKVLIKII